MDSQPLLPSSRKDQQNPLMRIDAESQTDRGEYDARGEIRSNQHKHSSYDIDEASVSPEGRRRPDM